MKYALLPLVCGVVILGLPGCEKSAPPPPPPDQKVESVNDLKPPKDVGPPVDSVTFEDGYKDGVTAGETAAKAVPRKTPAPPDDEINDLALQAAGENATRTSRWQRGYASGYRDGFQRISLGLK